MRWLRLWIMRMVLPSDLAVVDNRDGHVLSAEDFDAFVDACENPKPPTPLMIQAARDFTDLCPHGAPVVVGCAVRAILISPLPLSDPGEDERSERRCIKTMMPAHLSGKAFELGAVSDGPVRL